MIHRRNLFSLLAAPAIVRAGSLMPVVPFSLTPVADEIERRWRKGSFIAHETFFPERPLVLSGGNGSFIVNCDFIYPDFSGACLEFRGTTGGVISNCNFGIVV